MRDHSKDKSSSTTKNDKSPSLPSGKLSPKRFTSPKRTHTSSSPPSITKHRDDKRSESNKRERVSDDKRVKKARRDKEREYKEGKHRERETGKSVDPKDIRIKEMKQGKEVMRDDISVLMKTERKEKSGEREGVEKIPKIDKIEDKHKHKHKKKDRDRKDRDRDKSHKSKRRDKEKSPKRLSPFPTDEPREEKNEKRRALFSEGENECSNSSRSGREELDYTRKDTTTGDARKPKLDNERSKRDKTKRGRDRKGDRDERRKKRKSEKYTTAISSIVENGTDGEPLEKMAKCEADDVEVESVENAGISHCQFQSDPPRPPEGDKENLESAEDYMQMLRELQQKIMELEDNNELQRVVQVIAETGRYEVNARTFDFDLCLLEKSTVRQLQELLL